MRRRVLCLLFENNRYNFYVNRFPGQSVTTYLLMSMLEITVTLEKEEANGNIQPIMATLNGLINEVNSALK